MLDNQDIVAALAAALPTGLHAHIRTVAQILMAVGQGSAVPVITSGSAEALRHLQGTTFDLQSGRISVGRLTDTGIVIEYGAYSRVIDMPSDGHAHQQKDLRLAALSHDDLTLAVRSALPAILHHHIAAVVQVLTSIIAGIPPDATDQILAPSFQSLQGKPLPSGSGTITVRDVTGDGIAIGHGASVIHIHMPPTTNPAQQPVNALYQLRVPDGDFVNRHQEIDKLVRSLTSTTTRHGAVARISGIRGLGGVGKTELAFIVAHQVKAHFPDAQLVIDMRGSTDRPLRPAQAVQRAVRAFQPFLPPSDDLQHVQTLYRSLLCNKRVLLIADDARDAAQVRALLPPPGSALLITSRRKIELPTMTAVSLGAIPRDDAITLLVTICPRLGADARRLADLCGRLPLALRVSATFLNRHPMRRVDTYLNALTREQERLMHLRDPDDPLLDREGVDRTGKAERGHQIDGDGACLLSAHWPQRSRSSSCYVGTGQKIGITAMDDLLAAQTPTSGDISAHTVTGQGIAIGHGSHATVTHHHYAALAPASERERRNRTVMLQKVHAFWVAGVLENSLHTAALIDLGMTYQPDAVVYPWEMVIERPDS